jgi:hypothetical protein
VRGLGGFGGGVHVLYDQEIELPEKILHVTLMNPGVKRVRRDDPEPFDFVVANAFDDLVVSPTVFGWNMLGRKMEKSRDLLAMRGIREIVAAE